MQEGAICQAFVKIVRADYKYTEKARRRQFIAPAKIVPLFFVGVLPQESSTAVNALVSLACAMQVQTFRKMRGHAYASTMCIGNMRSVSTEENPFYGAGCGRSVRCRKCKRRIGDGART